MTEQELASKYIREKIPWVTGEMLEAFLKVGIVREFPRKTVILAPGQQVQWIPVVLEGLVKVTDRVESKELLLYYILPAESCVMSFFAGMNHARSKVQAVVEEDAVVFLIPSSAIAELLKQFPQLHSLFYDQYQSRYEELIGTIRHLLFDKMEKRLEEHLRKRAEVSASNEIRVSHRELANELGTAREVITRTIKKLEAEGIVETSEGTITILG